MNLHVFTKDQLLACPSQISCGSWEYCGIEKKSDWDCEDILMCRSSIPLQSLVSHSMYPSNFIILLPFFHVGPGENAVLRLLTRICFY